MRLDERVPRIIVRVAFVILIIGTITALVRGDSWLAIGFLFAAFIDAIALVGLEAGREHREAENWDLD